MTEEFVTNPNDEDTRRGCVHYRPMAAAENTTDNFSPSRIPFNIQPVSPSKTPEKDLESSRELKSSIKRKSKHLSIPVATASTGLFKDFTLFSTKRSQAKSKICPEADSFADTQTLILPADKDEVEATPKFIIRANGRFKLKWDLLIMIISIWNCFIIPVDIAFQPPALEGLMAVTINSIIDVIFGIDIVLNFRTSYIIEATGAELLQPSKIALHYLKGRFFIDLFATVPFDSILAGLAGRQVSGKLSLLSTLKIFRVLRLMKIISYLNASENTKHSLKIFKLLFYLIIYIHCQGCAWYFYT
jgi:hypothetical protein